MSIQTPPINLDVEKDKEAAKLLPPLPINNAEPTGYLPSILGSITRTIVSNLSIAAIAVSREVITWWFRAPIRFFRPYAISPYSVFNELNNGASSWRFIFETTRREGFNIVKLNVLPLLLLNSTIGMVLFNTYTISLHYLKSVQHSLLNPFACGFFAGTTQAIIANPLYRIQKSLSKTAHADNRRTGVLKLYLETYHNNLPKGGLEKLRYLYKGISYNLLKDSVGFALFFGTFESSSHLGKLMIRRIWGESASSHFFNNNKGSTARPRELAVASALVTISSGALAGAMITSFSYPMDRLKYETKKFENNMKSAVAHVHQNGGMGFLYRGISNVLLKSVPASSLGLFVYEVTSDWIVSL